MGVRIHTTFCRRGLKVSHSHWEQGPEIIEGRMETEHGPIPANIFLQGEISPGLLHLLSPPACMGMYGEQGTLYHIHLFERPEQKLDFFGSVTKIKKIIKNSVSSV